MPSMSTISDSKAMMLDSLMPQTRVTYSSLDARSIKAQEDCAAAAREAEAEAETETDADNASSSSATTPEAAQQQQQQQPAESAEVQATADAQGMAASCQAAGVTSWSYAPAAGSEVRQTAFMPATLLGFWTDSYGNDVTVSGQLETLTATLSRKPRKDIHLSIWQTSDTSEWHCGDAVLDMSVSGQSQVSWRFQDGRVSTWNRRQDLTPMPVFQPTYQTNPVFMQMPILIPMEQFQGMMPSPMQFQNFAGHERWSCFDSA